MILSERLKASLSAAEANFISISLASTFLNTSNTTSYSFTNQSIGAAPSAGERRFIVVIVGDTNNVSGVSWSGNTNEVTFGGSNADAILAYQNSPSGNESGVICAIKEMPTGTTMTLGVDPDITCLGVGGGVYRVITGSAGYAVRGTGTSTDASSPVITLSTAAQADDVAVSCISNVNGGNYSWPAGWTKDYEVDPQSTENTAGAHITFTGTVSSVTISQTDTGDTGASLVVALYPA